MATRRDMRRTAHENWPMIVALATAVAIGLLVFTVLRPAPAVPTPAGSPAQAVSSSQR